MRYEIFRWSFSYTERTNDHTKCVVAVWLNIIIIDVQNRTKVMTILLCPADRYEFEHSSWIVVEFRECALHCRQYG
jgi:ferredoxin-like protein FixX